MRCLKCGHVNRDSAKFCARCGTAPISPPPSSAEPNAPEQSAPAAPASAPQTPPPPPEPKQAREKPAANAQGDSSKAMGGPASAHKTKPSNATGELTLWVAIVVVTGILVAAIVWLYLLNQDSLLPIGPPLPALRTKPSPTLAATPAAPTMRNTAEDSLSEAPPPPRAKDKRVTDAPVVASAARLSQKQVKQLVGRLQQEHPAASCAAGETKVKRVANVPTAQARDIAKRAYPQLCAPVLAKPEPAPSPAPRKPVRTIDEAFSHQGAAECTAGLFGLICREKIRNKLCDGHWSTTQTPGQTICQQIDTSSRD